MWDTESISREHEPAADGGTRTLLLMCIKRVALLAETRFLKLLSQWDHADRSI